MFLLRYNAGNNGRPESTPNCTQDKDLNKKEKIKKKQKKKLCENKPRTEDTHYGFMSE